MRFILAIFAFVIATVLIGIGIAERTVFLPPSSLSVSTSQNSVSPYLYIDSEVLQSQSGNQTLSLSGSGTVFAAYGRTDDVKAWLNGSSYDALSLDSADSPDPALSSTVVPASSDGAENVASGSSNPAGSDLWLEEYTSDTALNRTFSLPAGYSMIVADDGTAPAPSNVQISWPLDDSTPTAVPLLLIGAFFVLVGLVLLLLGLNHMKRSQGPRRKQPSLPRGKRFSPSRTNAIESGVRRGRRSISRSVSVLVPALILGTVALSGCSVQVVPAANAATVEPTATPTSAEVTTTEVTPAATDTTPAATATPLPTATEPAADATATPTPVPTADSGPPPAVTTAQLNGILTKISVATAAADAAGDATALAERFTGPALALRSETYAIRKVDSTYAAPQVIPAGPGTVVLPQATDTWPRTVLSIVEDPTDTTVAPMSLMLVQQTPRSAYQVYYAIPLEPDTTVPFVAPATVGTSRLPADTKLLSLTPAQVAEGYADLLAVGDQSATYNDFDPTGDTLRTSVGVDYKAAKKAGLANTASIDFAKLPGDGQSIALATNQSGAIVALNIRESETVKVVVDGATVEPKGGVLAASGVKSTTKGTEAIYDYQLLFYIPPSGDTSKVQLLGFAQGLLSAKELP